MDEDRWSRPRRSGGGGDVIYVLGVIGAMAYYIQQSSGFWPIILAILKAFVWPAFAIYNILKFF